LPPGALTEVGGVDLRVPRDRNGRSFAPQIVRRGQTRLDGFTDRITAYTPAARHPRRPGAHLREMDGVDESRPGQSR
jgi:transposase-like protein